MFRVLAGSQRLCDGIRRRDFLRVGTLGALALPALASAAVSGSFGRAKRCILLFLTGGPSQLDSFDPKPDAPREIRGELATIPTRIPAVRFTELFPRLASVSDQFCVVRSVTHRDAIHTSAGYTMLTGMDHPLANSSTAKNIKIKPTDHPHLGAILARYRPNRDATPTFAALPEFIRDDRINDYPGQGGGILGQAFDPFRVDANAAKTGFDPPQIALPYDVSAGRLSGRRQLRELLTDLERFESSADGYQRQAYDLIGSSALQHAFDLAHEPDRVRAAYGSHLFGQGCLLARRLLEAGVALATVYWHYEGPEDSPVWDTHRNNFRHMRERLAPPTDQAIAALLGDLADRGLLTDTLVICMGEFGRTPRVNRDAGRSHWPGAQSILLAGAGVPAGAVIGSTDRHAAYPAESPVAPADLMATFLHLLGVPAGLHVHDRTGRPLPICTAKPLAALLAH